MPTFRNTLFHLHRQVDMKMEQCFETLAHKHQTPVQHPEESVPQINYLHFNESEDESPCSKKVDRGTASKSLQFASHALLICSLYQYYPLTAAQISRTFRYSSHNLYVFLNFPTYATRLSISPFLSSSPQQHTGNSTNCKSPSYLTL
jgi:hypothetical protein